MTPRTDLVARAQVFADQHRVQIFEQLGRGIQGIVLAVESQINQARSAIKVHERAADYGRERDVYQRLQERHVVTIGEYAVPQLLGFDDALWIIQMTIVTPPYLLDFAGAYLDQPPDFSEEVLADWRADMRDQFESRWPEVQAILRHLEGYGVFMVDVNPGNVSFGA